MTQKQTNPALGCKVSDKPYSSTGKRTDFGIPDKDILDSLKSPQFKYGYKGVLKNLAYASSYYGVYNENGKRKYTATFRNPEGAAWALYVLNK